MNRNIDTLENPTLQFKLGQLYSNPWNLRLRRAARSLRAVAKLRARAAYDNGYIPVMVEELPFNREERSAANS